MISSPLARRAACHCQSLLRTTPNTTPSTPQCSTGQKQLLHTSRSSLTSISRHPSSISISSSSSRFSSRPRLSSAYRNTQPQPHAQSTRPSSTTSSSSSTPTTSRASSLPRLYHDALDEYTLAEDSTDDAAAAAYAAADRAAALSELQKLRRAFQHAVAAGELSDVDDERTAWAARIDELERWNAELARRAGEAAPGAA